MTNRMIGPATVRFGWQGMVTDWGFSPDSVMLGGVEVPAWISQRRHGVSGPDVFVKVAVRDGSPQIVTLSFISREGQEEVRQKDLRKLDVDRLPEALYAAFVAEFDSDRPRDDQAVALRIAERFIEQQRLPREYRVITDDFLRQVAKVYRENFARAPLKAVAKHFGVKDRMASVYVGKARQKGFLPPTKQGQKKA